MWRGKKSRRDISIGDRFGRLIATDAPHFRASPNGRPYWYVRVRCDCGREKETLCCNLLKPVERKSCGCWTREIASITNRTHGRSGDRIYVIWRGMKSRCDPKTTHKQNRKNYVERGISVCREWQEFTSFLDWSLKNGYRADLTIERINNKGDYEPGNCTWIPSEEQAKNRRHATSVTAFGESKSMIAWSRDPRCVVSANLLCQRLKAGRLKGGPWSPEAAITVPSRKT